MKISIRLLSALLLIAFLLCYLEWGKHAAFLFQIEYDILSSGRLRNSQNLFHPAILLPLAGQLFLLAAAIFKRVGRLGVNIGLVGTGTLAALILVGGIMARSPATIASTMPYAGLTAFYMVRYRRLTA